MVCLQQTFSPIWVAAGPVAGAFAWHQAACWAAAQPRSTSTAHPGRLAWTASSVVTYNVTVTNSAQAFNGGLVEMCTANCRCEAKRTQSLTVRQAVPKAVASNAVIAICCRHSVGANATAVACPSQATATAALLLE
jgi:hypothetical protein